MNKDWLKYKVESIEALEEESSNLRNGELTNSILTKLS